MKTAAIFVADGTDDTEAVTTRNILARAGIEAIFVNVKDGDQVNFARGTKVIVEEKLSKLGDRQFDALILPGGLGGAKTFADSTALKEMLVAQEKRGALVAAMCASPQEVLKKFGMLEGKRWTGYKGMRPEDADPKELTVKDGSIVTSICPGTAPDFGLRIVSELLGKEAAEKVDGGFYAK